MKQNDLNYFLLILLVFLLIPVGVKAQDYRMELGVSGGSSFYMGDANNNRLFRDNRPSFGMLARYNLNDRFALRANALVAGVAGSTRGQATSYMNGEEVSFDRRIVDAGMQFEVNFYKYGAPDFKSGGGRISPYILFGFGFTGYEAAEKRVCVNFPFGLGLKAKVAPRINLGCEWTFRKTVADDLDFSSNSSGFQLQDFSPVADSWNKNKDWYSVLMLYVSFDIYSIGSKCFK